MAYIALYRKWRPGTFKDLAGQAHVSRTLSQAILTGRVGHAYLFAGPRGTGKTSTAKILAKALNCEKGPTPDPCGACGNCRKIDDGSSMDVYEIDAASNRGIDEIRELRETVKFAPAEGRYKVYIIDEVHMLTQEAFNALLKTLEEPPPHVVFILATTEAHKVPPTIQSRCQRYDFRRITVEDIEKRLSFVVEEMGFEAEREALSMIALQADGGLRDALGILDQCAALSEGKVTAERVREVLGLIGHDWIYRLTDALAKRRSPDILAMLAELLREGKDLRQILAELSLHFRSLMVYQAAGTLDGMELYRDPPEVLASESLLFSQERVVEIIHRLHEAMNELRWSPQPRISVEVCLLSLCRETSPEREAVPSAQLGSAPEDGRIERLEAKIARMAALLAEEKEPAIEKEKEPTKSAGKRERQEPPPAEPSLPLPASREDGSTLWKKVLEGFRAANKRPMLACLDQGTCLGMTETQFFLRFPGDMMASMTMRIYRKAVEEALERLGGRPLRLVCSAEEAPPPPLRKAQPKGRPSSEKQGEKPDFGDLSPEERANMEHAMDILGDHFIPPPGDREAPPPEEE